MKRILAVALFLATPVFAQGQATVSPLIAGFDSRWQPFLGCWRIVEDQQGGQALPVAPGVLVCVQPSGSSAVSILTTLEGRTVLEQTITPDGLARSIGQTDCSGTQLSEWSRNGERLFTRVDLQCAGQPRREVAGVTLLAGGFWIDAQASTSGEPDLKLRRYQRTTEPAVRIAPRAGSPMSIEDIVEASPRVPAPALAAAIAASGTSFSLDSSTLARLADAGVPSDVIDVMVAQAYPDQFPSNSTPPAQSSYQSGASASTTIIGSTYPTYPIYYGATAYPTYGLSYYDPYYSSYYHYYYSPFAYYSYWGSPYYPYVNSYRYRSHANFYRYYPRSGVAVTPYSNGPNYGPRDPRPVSPGPRGNDGAVVNGRGYTRRGSSSSAPSSGSTAGADATPSAPQPAAPIAGTARARPSAGSSGSSAGSSAGSSGSSGSSAGSSGSRSSGSSGSSGSGSSGSGGARGWRGGSGSGGRTAQPR